MKIIIVPFQKKWIEEFQVLAADLLAVLKPLDPTIVHIGSTAISGMYAKPIIDIMVGLPENMPLEACINPMLEAGYFYFEIYNQMLPERRFFALQKDDFEKGDMAFIIKNNAELEIMLAQPNARKANIHIVGYRSPDWIRHIAFRDYLRAHEDIRQMYNNLKLDIAEKEYKNVNAYNLEKDAFIKKYEALALNWYFQK